jgi:hypothetical protein
VFCMTAAMLIFPWLLELMSSREMGGPIHLLRVVALIVVLMGIVDEEREDCMRGKVTKQCCGEDTLCALARSPCRGSNC